MSNETEDIDPATAFQSLLRQAEGLRKHVKFSKMLLALQVLISASFLIAPINPFNVVGFFFLALGSWDRIKETKREIARLEDLPVRWGKGEDQGQLAFEGFLGGPPSRERVELDWEEREEIDVEYGKLLLAKKLAESQVRTYKGSMVNVIGWMWVFGGLVAAFSGLASNGFSIFHWYLLAAAVLGSLAIGAIYRIRGDVLRKRVEYISDKIIHLEIAEGEESLRLAREDAQKVWTFTKDKKKGFFAAFPK